MASVLSRLFSQYGEKLSSEQRKSFVMDVLRLDHPSSCEAWDFLWHEGLISSDHGQSTTLSEFAKTNCGRKIVEYMFISAGQQLPKALVPGCGRGYDALTLALMGFETFAIDISANAIEHAIEWLESLPPSFDGCDFLGRLHFVVADFFNCEMARGPFAIVYDYMFFCAIPPVLRDDWGRRMSEVVEPGGYLVVIVYPTVETFHPGPPYVVSIDMISNILAESGTVWTKEQEFLSNPVGLDRELLVVWRKDNTTLSAAGHLRWPE